MSLALDTRGILDTLRPRRDAVRRRLATVRRRVRARLLLAGTAWTWAAVFLFCAASLALDWLLRLSLPVRMTLLAVGAVGVAWVAWRHLLSPLLFRLDDLDLAAILDRRVPGVGQRVAAVLQLPGLLESRILASPSMVQAAVLEHAQALEQADLWSAFDRRAHRRQWLLLIATALAAGGFYYACPEAAAIWERRWFLASHERWPQHTYLSVVGLGDDGRLLVARGESLPLEVTAQPQFSGRSGAWKLGGRGETLLIPSLGTPTSRLPEQVSIRYEAASGFSRVGNFTHYGGSEFRYEIPQVVEPLDVSVTGGDDWFGPIRVEPIDRPTVSSLVVLARRPGSDEAQQHTPEGADAQLLFLPDTKLELQLVSSVPLAAATLSAKEGSPPPLERRDDTHYLARWTMREPQTLEISLISSEGNLESKPYYLSIGLLIDRPPRVLARSSGVGRRVTPQARIPLALHASDDFGLTSLTAEIEATVPKEEKPETKLHKVSLELPPSVPENPPTDFEIQPMIGLTEYSVAPGTIVKLRGAAVDNCAQGSQTGASRWLTFQVVTPEELFYEILMRQRAQRAKFAAALETAKSQTEPLAGLPTAEVAFALVRKHQVIARQIWQVANALDATLQEMALNELGSVQARELLKTKVIEAIRQLHGAEMVELRSALEAVAADPAGADQSLTAAREQQQAVVDQMAKILEQMSQWENFVDVLNQLKSIIKLEGGVLEATEQEKKKRTQELFDD
ncbi:MAG TPA: hypothetical protein VJ783_31320 [Pirellulales bacterium]|nr:hypothetical protein [Pirellulales bacterium]